MNLQCYAGKIMVKEHQPTNAIHIPAFYYLQDKLGTIFYVGEYQKHLQKSWKHLKYQNMDCVKSVRIRSYSGPYFPHSDWIQRVRSVYPYSVRMRKNADQNNSEYGHFLSSDVQQSQGMIEYMSTRALIQKQSFADVL